jgi:choline transport protein
MLAPRRFQKFLSYITAWVTLCGWQAAAASGAFASGTFVQGLIVLCNPSYEPKGWQNTLFAWAILVFGTTINTLATGLLPNFEGLILILHICGFFAILIPLVYLAPHGSASDIFTTFYNFGGWNTQTYSFFIGLVGPVYSFIGGDCAVHMAEEIKNASIVVPRALLTSIVINGSLGFGMLLALLFSIGDLSLVPTTVLATPLGFPFIQVFLNATGSIAGSAVMASIVLVLGISASVGVLASSSRMFWSFARDRGLPFSYYISRVSLLAHWHFCITIITARLIRNVNDRLTAGRRSR